MKFDVTPELASLLKTMRARNRVSSKDVAEHIGKSPSYLSKLEGGSVQTIERDQLRRMLTFIAGSDDFYGVVLPDVANLLFASVGGRYVSQAWFLQFDFIERPVVVSAEMSQDMRNNFEALGVDVAQITDYINANVDSEASESFPANQAISMEFDGSYRFIMRIEFEISDVEQVLSGHEVKVPYLVAYNVAHKMFRMQRHPGVMTKLPPDDAIALLSATADYMDRWNIHSLGGFAHYLASGEFASYQLPLVSSQGGVVDRVAAQLSDLVERDSLNAISELNTFLDTLDWDPAFACKVLGLPFAALGAMSFANKKQLIEELYGVVNRYASMDELERKMESY